MSETRTSRRGRRESESEERRHDSGRLGLRDQIGMLFESMREHARVTIVVVFILFALVMLYGPTRNYYVAWRSGQDLQAYYEAISEQNELLTQDVGRLTSEEGIEDEAHRHGLIREDETSVKVEGLPEEDVTELTGEVVFEPEHPFYISVLDFIFFYHEDSWQ